MFRMIFGLILEIIALVAVMVLGYLDTPTWTTFEQLAFSAVVLILFLSGFVLLNSSPKKNQCS